MERKYSFEAGLNVFTSYKTIIPVENLNMLKKIDPHRYHIYGIMAYNQIFFRKERIEKKQDGIKMVFFMIKDGKEVDYELPFIKLAEGLDHRKIDIKILYPATKMTLSILDEEFLKQNPKVKRTIDIINSSRFFIYGKFSAQDRI